MIAALGGRPAARGRAEAVETQALRAERQDQRPPGAGQGGERQVVGVEVDRALDGERQRAGRGGRGSSGRRVARQLVELEPAEPAGLARRPAAGDHHVGPAVAGRDVTGSDVEA